MRGVTRAARRTAVLKVGGRNLTGRDRVVNLALTLTAWLRSSSLKPKDHGLASVPANVSAADCARSSGLVKRCQGS